MLYNIHYDICALMITACLFAFILLKKGLFLKSNKFLFTLALITFFATVFDISSAIGNSYPDYYCPALRNFFNYGYLLSQNALCYIFFVYTFSLCDLFYGDTHKLRTYSLLAIPYAIDVIFLSLNPFYHFIFYYNSMNQYSHGAAFYVLYFNALLYLLASVWILYRYGHVTKEKRSMCYAFVLSCFAAAVIQKFFPYLLLTLYVNSLCLLGVSLVIDNKDEILDPVTKCFNRRFFVQTNRERVGRNISYNVLSFKILYLNLHIATLGIDLTHQFLALIGAYLHELADDIEVFYYENDSFALLYADDTLNDVLMSKIKQRFSELWCLNNTELLLEISPKLFQIGDQITSVEELLFILDSRNHEDLKMGYKAPSVMDYRRELSVEKAIKKALITDGFFLRYQPMWNPKKNMITHAKVSAYLQDEELGLIESEEFMSVAEKNDLGNEIGKNLLYKICRNYKENNFDALGIDVMEINISCVHFMNPNLKKLLLSLLKEYGINISHLSFQVSLEMLTDCHETILANLRKLHQAGFQLTLTGYGNELLRIMDLLQEPMNGVRFDSSVLQQAMTQDKVMILFKNSVRMFHEMELIIEIDGVDDVYQKEMAVDLGCDYLLGAYFSNAMEEEDFYRYCRGFNLR